ncbi:unnamed protein product [Medioppia subpectinata]|uniref:ABC transmembrane type-1 domain-containing protein n=1 Tax=Medioppia subpectinata TaxID=1979941 RepID=A0A7R9L2B1_9ACAR|nr:unnamed protein product [Medioppia subpectinata]CAG2113045.1 unnamed protein product [Medioppia subpectinata]
MEHALQCIMALFTDMGCCLFYEIYGSVKAQINNKWINNDGKYVEQDMMVSCNAILNGQQLDEKYCKGLKGTSDMSPDCQKRVEVLASGADFHRLFNPVPVLLAAIVVWIYPLFVKGMRKDCLDFEDMSRCSQYDASKLMIAKLTDNRLRHMVEIISGMRVIKMYSWEQPFADLVAEARK